MIELLKILISIVSFVIVYYIFRSRNKNINPLKNWKFYLTWLLTGFLMFIIVTFGIGAFLIYKYTPPSRDFNAEEWNNDTSKRNELVEDLMDSKILKGKNKTEIISLLGTKEASLNYTETIEYYICPGTGFLSLDCDFLIIKFENEKVESYKLIQ